MTPFKLPKKRSKYGNKITVVDGRKFHSKAEAERYLILKDRLEKGEISDLKCQVPFGLVVNDQIICAYIADSTYYENGKYIVEDVKGKRTDVYRIKRALMKACLGIEITEINVKSKWRKKRK